MFVYIIAFLSAFSLTYLVRVFALKKSIVDVPNARSSHTIATPRGGGIAIIVVWFVGLSYFFASGEINQKLFFALFAGIVLFVISILDDIYSLKPVIRLIAQAISVGLALFFIGGVQTIDFGFFVFDSIWINTFLAFVGLIWFINLFNFLDGIDGYASTETIAVGLAFYFFVPQSILLVLVFSTLGFLMWNWQPAKIFMGDAGSTVLGFTLGVLSLYYSQAFNISLFVFLIPSSLFWFDATLTLFRRWRNKENLSEAHKKHAYQRLVQSGFSHQKVVLWSILANVFLFVLAWGAVTWPKYVLLFLLVDILSLYFITRWIDKRKAFE